MVFILVKGKLKNNLKNLLYTSGNALYHQSHRRVGDKGPSPDITVPCLKS